MKLEKFREARADAARIEWLAGLVRINRQVTRAPTDPAGYLARGRYFEAGGERQAAIADYTRAVQIAPQLVSAWTSRAAAWLAEGQPDKAIADCDQALKIEGNEAAWSIRGDAWLNKGEHDKAIADFESAQRFDSTVAQAYLRRADVLEQSGNKDEAARDRQRAAELDPNLGTATR